MISVGVKMKRISIITLALFVIALAVGLDCRRTYFRIDISDKKELEKYRFSVHSFSSSDFETEETEEGGTTTWVSQIIDEKTGKVLEEKTEEVENNNTQGPKITQEDIEKNPFLKYDNMGTEEGIRAVLDDAQYVVLAKGRGKAKALGETLQQEIYVEKVLKGDDRWREKNIKVINTYGGVGMPGKEDKDGGFMLKVNMMEEGEEYLVFLNPVQLKGEIYENVAYLADYKFLPYFNLEDKENKIAKPEEKDGIEYIYYKDMKDNEFFVCDEVALNKLLEIKQEYLKKYEIGAKP